MDRLAGAAALVALEVAAAGGRVELAGAVGDDADGDLAAVLLGRAGVGHAALLRDPAACTPRWPALGRRQGGDRPIPRLEAEEVALGLRYLVDCRVLVIAEPLPEDALAAALEAGAYHGASVVALVAAGEAVSDRLETAATVLSLPTGQPDPRDAGAALPGERAAGSGEAEEVELGAFCRLVAAFAIGLDEGRPAPTAFASAVRATGWERAGGV